MGFPSQAMSSSTRATRGRFKSRKRVAIVALVSSVPFASVQLSSWPLDSQLSRLPGPWKTTARLSSHRKICRTIASGSSDGSSPARVTINGSPTSMMLPNSRSPLSSSNANCPLVASIADGAGKVADAKEANGNENGVAKSWCCQFTTGAWSSPLTSDAENCPWT
ncbi:hypothetical protein-signal peptide and transmembrane prediction [Rhodopirellula baltica SH 1]|uniref:Uncharacterized protein n=1 Tax=Rhodopirellula baltica (strain DSM 10527 / NCIMB 13988 / SH1) TaxID=243090 RepID=Q7UM77_RHOBA|nr:hypothetical protein-signal peptide and transmembrane prediction [Rhodopirellula baltica SH 1]